MVTLPSFPAALRLGLIRITNHVKDTLTENNIQQLYPQLFQGIACLRDLQMCLHVHDSVSPVAQPNAAPFRHEKASRGRAGVTAGIRHH